LVVARSEPLYSYAGASSARDVALLGAGWALIGTGSAYWLRRPRNLFGPLLVAAGFVWFMADWNNPGIGSALAFTIGLVFSGLACAALVGHAALAYPSGRLVSALERAAVSVAYVGSVVVLGLLPTLVFDPQAQGCSECPRNLLLVSDRPGAVDDLNRVGVHLGLAWALALAALAAVRFLRASPWTRVVLGAGVAYMGLVAAEFATSLDRGFVTNGELERNLWVGQAIALIGIAVGAGWALVRGRRARTRVARLIVELGQAPSTGGLRGVLGGIVGDPHLVLAYPVDGIGRLVDAEGRPVDLARDQEQTTLLRDGRPAAVLGHAPGLLDDEQLVDAVTAAARLALENERLQAQARARLKQLRASQARIVAAGDAERRRLERDLHDGAQQRLVALGLSLRLVRSQLGNRCHPETARQLDLADSELTRATSELRELAHGIFPAVLADGGLSVAVRALAEESPVRMRIGTMPEARFPAPVETAAYSVVSEAARCGASSLVISGEHRAGRLALRVETHHLGELDVVGLHDRLGALDGRLELDHGENGRVIIRAELPCVS
jgi:signal transduction histidine kinase